MHERMEAGELYITDDPVLSERARRAERLMHAFNRSAPTDEDRMRILGDLLGHVGADVAVRPPLFVDYGSSISIGARTFVNYGLTALDAAPITIGEDVQIGPGVQLLTPVHPVEPELRRARWESARPITVGDNVWLGGGAVVLPGVTIGADTVVGAGAVVVRDLPPRVVAVGNPAKIVRRV